MRNLEETFEYDSQNRLKKVRLGPTLTGASVYDSYGRMTAKTANGQLVFYDAEFGITAKPHAMNAATTVAENFPQVSQTVTYTGFDKVSKVKQGNDSLCYTYGYDHQRILMEEHMGNRHRTKRYVGNCEYITKTNGNVTDTQWLTYLTGPTGVYAVVATENGREKIHYIMKDNLGSWTTITDEEGSVEQYLNYDAWGNLRNPNYWTGFFSGVPMFDRGYTGHEHLSSFGLINMNGRMYDPVMSSFLSVDQYVSSPENAQGFNRYAYCMNNPLRYVDPSGWLPVGGGGHGYTPNSATNDPYAYVDNRYLEPRDLGLRQLDTSDPIITWMEENSLHGSGNGPKGGGFYDEKGNYLGTMANMNERVYVICSENIDRGVRKEIKKFLNGKKSAITEETIFQYFIEIEPLQANRQKMYDIVSQDDGTGGTSPNNNREYGGYIDNGVVIEEPPGPIKNPRDEQYNSIEIHAGYPSFHSHSSGYLIERDRTVVYDYYWIQEPSLSDIQNAGNHVHYVFGRWNNHVYIYNINGVQTIMRTNNFINIGL